MKAKCPGCDVVLQMPDGAIGRKLRCPKCGKHVKFGSSQQEKPPNPHPLVEQLNKERSELDEERREGILDDLFEDDDFGQSPNRVDDTPRRIVDRWTRPKKPSRKTPERSKTGDGDRSKVKIAAWGALLCIILAIFSYESFYKSLRPEERDRTWIRTLSGREIVSKDEYDQIAHGMSYRETVSIIGHEGTEMASNKIDSVPDLMASVTTIMYGWQNSNGSNMNAMFQNDKLIQKAQYGLE